MIECSKENIWYSKRKSRRFKRFFALLSVVLFVLICALYYKFIISSNIYNICANYAYSYCTESVNEAVFNSLGESTTYSDIVNVEKNNDGEIVLLTANSYVVNLISREITNATTKIVKDKMDKGVPVPLLTFTGIGILSGYGRDINLKTMYVSDVLCDFISTLESVGVNQTLHSIYIELTINVNINVPLSGKKETVVNRVLLAESVLVGEVPDTYLSGNLFRR